MATQDKALKTVEALSIRFDDIIGTAVAFTTAAIITTVCRIFAKRLSRARLVMEDYTIFLCLLIFIVSEALVMTAAVIGQRTRDSNDFWDQKHTAVVYAYSLFYFTMVALAIASVLFLYRRIFVSKFMSYSSSILLVFTSLWWLMCTICEFIFPGSLPQTFPGNPQRNLPVSYITWWFAVGLVEQTIIFVTVLLPSRELARLQMSSQKKIFVAIIFATSSLCLGSGIARLALLYRVGASTIDVAMGDVLFNVHVGAAIIGANLPVCWPIVSHRKELTSSLFSSVSSTASRHRLMSPKIEEIHVEKAKAAA